MERDFDGNDGLEWTDTLTKKKKIDKTTNKDKC